MGPVIDALFEADEDDVFAMATYLASLEEPPTDAEIDEAATRIAALDWAETERRAVPMLRPTLRCCVANRSSSTPV